MTAIAIAQLSSGFVIAADGRMRLDAKTRARATAPELARETEYALKVFEITGRDKKVAWTITGNFGVGLGNLTLAAWLNHINQTV